MSSWRPEIKQGFFEKPVKHSFLRHFTACLRRQLDLRFLGLVLDIRELDLRLRPQPSMVPFLLPFGVPVVEESFLREEEEGEFDELFADVHEAVAVRGREEAVGRRELGPGFWDRGLVGNLSTLEMVGSLPVLHCDRKGSTHSEHPHPSSELPEDVHGVEGLGTAVDLAHGQRSSLCRPNTPDCEGNPIDCS